MPGRFNLCKRRLKPAATFCLRLTLLEIFPQPAKGNLLPAELKQISGKIFDILCLCRQRNAL